MLLTEFLADIYAPLRAIDDRTILLYRLTIRPFSDFLGRPATLADFEELTVARFLAARVRERAPGTAAKDRSQLRAMWEFAARRKLVDTWPTIPLIKVPERVPEAWLTEEMARLLLSASHEKAVYDGIPAALWWRALLLMAYDTGERATAMLSIRWRSFRGSHVLYEAESRKGKRRDISRDISVETADAMLAIRGGRGLEDLIFPWPRQKSYLWRRLEIILQRAGLPSGRKDKFHRIRRTTASYYEAAGGSAQQLLDHADPATTRKYLDPRIVKGVSAPSVMPRIAAS
jgi:integrase